MKKKKRQRQSRYPIYSPCTEVSLVLSFFQKIINEHKKDGKYEKTFRSSNKQKRNYPNATHTQLVKIITILFLKHEHSFTKIRESEINVALY